MNGNSITKKRVLHVACNTPSPHSSSPVAGSRPMAIFMFSMAAPLAPLPKLSNWAETVNRSSLPQMKIRRESFPARVLDPNILGISSDWTTVMKA